MRNRSSLLSRFALAGLLAASWSAVTIFTATAADPDALFAEVQARHARHGLAAELPEGEHRSCGSRLVRDVVQALPQMTPAQQDWLARNSSIFGPIIRRQRQIDAGGVVTDALPSEPLLTQTMASAHCVAHYTLTDAAEKVPNVDYVKMVLSTLEAAIKSEGKDFHRATAEPDSVHPVNDHEGKPKLQVYIRNLDNVPSLGAGVVGACTPTAAGSGPGKSDCYFHIRSNLGNDSESRRELRVTCYHEYMHGVQFTYNFGITAWMSDGQAVWAEVRYGKSAKDLGGYLSEAESVANAPEKPLWEDIKNRRYSAAAFVLELVHQKHQKIQNKWLEAAVAQNDSQKSLTQALGGTDAFSKVFRKYLLHLYQQDIDSLKKSEIPAVPVIMPPITQLGEDITAAVPPSGAKFQMATPDSRIPNKHLVAKVEAGSSGNPEVLLIKNPKHSDDIEVAKPDEVAVLEGFKHASTTLVIATDSTADSEITATTDITGKLFSPFFKIKNTVAASPINGGDSGPIDITYDLLGTPKGSAVFPVEVRVIEKGPDVADHASGDSNYTVGENQVAHFFFNTSSSTKGLYRFRLRFTTPTKGYEKDKIPRVDDDTSFSIRVIPTSNLAPDSGEAVGPSLNVGR